MPFELAQVNIASLVQPLDSERLAGFVAELDPVNEAADSAPGFVWRLQTDDGNATIEAFAWDVGDSAGLITNLPVWTDVEHLTAFVHGVVHTRVLRRRREWFDPMREVFAVC